MGRKTIHIINIFLLVVLTVFNLLVLFGFGMSATGVTADVWFGVTASYLIWAILYTIQISMHSKRARISSLVLSVVLLFVWSSGLGDFIGGAIFM
ncbi:MULTISPECIES: hypothetical protein [Pontibacillus]|uniref:Uncharacterized protein n=1 Tax=Pontibacillus chungwhensis TaxID=265426 RepID=A0ABY8V1C3_9BACI|nr:MULTISPECIES: hypothetical protein [Pontibacillus]MCD5324469.1 hypothetical protein [Pontibacillus sp. HN14]WIF99238.1 hypothetical protein QNI29_06140 [Pontibacillus chungwhensis]